MKRSLTVETDSAVDSIRKKQRIETTNSTQESDRNNGESTATIEGNLMHQTLSKLNPQDQARYEAYRRSCFPANAVSNFVAHSLHVNSIQTKLQMAQMQELLGGSGTTTGEADELTLPTSTTTAHNNNTTKKENQNEIPHASQIRTQTPKLEELVAPPSAAGEITVLVSTIAKLYAQRLVQSARSVATLQGYSRSDKLLPTHFLEAHRVRRQMGVDPGFYQSPIECGRGGGSSSGGSGGSSSSLTGGLYQSYGSGPIPGCTTALAAAALQIQDRNQVKLEAAIRAQEKYDEWNHASATDGDANNVGNITATDAGQSSNDGTIDMNKPDEVISTVRVVEKKANIYSQHQQQEQQPDSSSK